MPIDIPTIEPSQFEAGTTVKWTKDLSTDYPADDGWALTYTFINASGKFAVSASASAKIFSVVIAAADSLAFLAGAYKWVSRVTKAAETYTVAFGHCEVLPNLAASSIKTFEDRSHVKKVLDSIEAVIEGRATKDQMSYMIAGRQLSRTLIADLLVLRDRYRADYARELDAENIAKGLGTGKKILTRFIR